MLAALFTPYIDGVLVVAFAYACVTIGLQITLASGQFSVAHAALMGLGGYAGGIATKAWDWPFLASLAFGLLVGGLFGIAFAVALQRTSGVLLGTVTIAAGQALSIVMRNTTEVFGVKTGGSQGLTGIPTKSTLAWAAGGAAFALGAALLLRRSRAGMGMLALGKDETVARSLGVWQLGTRVWGFGMGGALAGLGGVLLAHNNGVIQPANLSFANEPLFFIFLMVGGLTTPWGALAGAVAVWWLQELLRFPWSTDGHFLFLQQNDRYWILGALLVLVVLFRPYGVLVRRPMRFPAAAPSRETSPQTTSR
ncbi:MAG: branched-chain amino acid ABC transporter permease [Ilumatobacteraceae bacterium]